jgi:3-oxoacyl-[acyl-carrier-protein] synthase II
VRARRIAISGVGAVSALGHSAPATFAALVAGARGIAPLRLFDPGDVRSRLVGEVQDLDVSAIAPRGAEADFSRTDAMAVLAACEAARAARLDGRSRLGLVLGGTAGGMFETEIALSSPDLPHLSAERAARLVSYPLSASISQVARALGGVVRARSICSACSGGAIALVQAAAWLARGDVDQVLAGGADGLCSLTVLGFNSLGATDPGLCRPFDRARAGLNLGEGAAVLVLEREETARARGAEVLAWLDGYAVGAEAHHITHPEPTGGRASQLLRQAMERAGLHAADIGYVNAHGTGTQQNDAMEARALLDVLGPSAGNTWVSSSKAQLGHTLGASGALEAAITVLALVNGEVPPTAGLVEPELPGLRHALEPGQRARLGAALSSSFGFGGMSCVLAFAEAGRRAPEHFIEPRRVSVRSGVVFGADAEPDKLLDPERSRRFDRASALAALGAEQLSATLESATQRAETGLILGTAFGNVERTMAFLARAHARGPRHVPPAEFPHLVPSAPAGNASIYSGLRGPVFAVSDLARSGEAAFALGCELIELGAVDQLVVGAVAPRDAIVERVLGPLLEPAGFCARARGDGAGFTLLSAESSEHAPEVLRHLLIELESALPPELPPPSGKSLTILSVATAEVRAWLARSSWADAPQLELAEAHGYHEALGAIALSHAAGALLRGEIEQALVVSGDAQVLSAFLLGRRRSAAR